MCFLNKPNCLSNKLVYGESKIYLPDQNPNNNKQPKQNKIFMYLFPYKLFDFKTFHFSSLKEEINRWTGFRGVISKIQEFRCREGNRKNRKRFPIGTKK